MSAIGGRARDAARRIAALGSLAGLVLATPASAGETASPASLLLFGSLEASPSVFVTTGAKLALDRLDREGFVALANLGGGRRREATLTRSTAIGAVVFGYQWFADWGVVAAYLGPEGSVEMETTGCGCARILPARFGLRLHGEVWARPSDETLLTATLVLGTTRTSAWSRLAWGYRLWGAYLGPEGALYRDETGYRKWNVGLHATDLALGRFSLRLSAGLQVSSDRRDAGPYVGLTAWTPW
ncbi:cellulose biosynthesis protein BcsS [Methylobacterium sp. J-068]|uniref:cellulose biosynthesis protein BcsS n=1 Tax=Methylobacterium sp. J-068 TaxID=2836649 RepID=UPI001FBA19A5|nr:cellulose biosynthesis protein BcsS [Methylobacterium sp. J-068]MCJ2036852.1 cellulose biosynthesis protein BcsS [Methylobacterium sp. J-068]